jgi:hypothetical protein
MVSARDGRDGRVMKVRPGLPPMPNVVSTPTAGGAVPVPLPNVPLPNLSQSSFSPANGVERRFSVRFLQGVEAKLKLAGCDAGLTSELVHRFKHMDRTGLDREGRVIERLLESANPKQHLALYGLLARSASIVTPNGAAISANDQGSWTIRPPGKEPFELLDRPGLKADLGGGYSAVVTDQGTLTAAGEELSRETSSRTQERSTEFLLALGPANAALATYNATPLVALMGWYTAQTVADTLGPTATYLDRCGLPEAAAIFRGGATGAQLAADVFALGNPALSSSGAAPSAGALPSGVSLVALNAMPRAAHDQIMRLLEKTGRAAAPSRRSDPLLEKAAILRQVAKDPLPFLQGTEQQRAQAMNALANFSHKISGAAREVILDLSR